ncbi:threonine aldolase family protein [Rhodobacteraceae bacterium KLH11]|nr:threonine aldolase family protein [Rhodobacteraceae bacterium KLH11]
MNRHDTPSAVPSSNADLVDIPGGREELDTPCLLVDLPVFKQNIERAAQMVADTGKAFTPHLKAHKTPDIAEMQCAASAAGFCVASIGEAEVFAKYGDTPLTITSATVTGRQMARIAALSKQVSELTVVVDTPPNIRALANLDATVSVLIDIDMGRGRSACTEEAQAVHLAREIMGAPNLNLAGLQCYAGQLSHMNDFHDREEQAAASDRRAGAFLAAVGSIADGPLRCSGGSTGASMFDLASSALTDLQWGSYALMDVEYGLVQATPDGNPLPFEPALRVATRVISAGHETHVITDAGDKRFANKYGAAPRVASPNRYLGAEFRPVSDEHGELKGSPLLRLGEILEVIPPHCDPTVNLFDALHVVDGDRLVDIWSIAARGVY